LVDGFCVVKCERNSRSRFSHSFDLINDSSIPGVFLRNYYFAVARQKFSEMYTNPKNKASFRIADILHQQQQQQQQQTDSQLLAHHLMLKNGAHPPEKDMKPTSEITFARHRSNVGASER
jgi:hypothetical protein